MRNGSVYLRPLFFVFFCIVIKFSSAWAVVRCTRTRLMVSLSRYKRVSEEEGKLKLTEDAGVVVFQKSSLRPSQPPLRLRPSSQVLRSSYWDPSGAPKLSKHPPIPLRWGRVKLTLDICTDR